MAMDEQDFNETTLQYLFGPVVLVAFALSYNEFAGTLGLPTISSSIRWARKHPLGAWIAGGVIGGLLAHWFLDSEEN
jgi:hypothetical protein